MDIELKTQTDVFTLPLPKGKLSEVAYFDQGKPGVRAKGLALRVRKDGCRTWVYFYRFKGRQRKMKIGNAGNNPGWTLAKARAKALALRVEIDGGADPAEDKRIAEAEAKESKTFRQVIDAYLNVRTRTMKPRSLMQARLMLENQWKPFHGLAIHEISTDMVADRLVDIERYSGPASRNRSRSVLSAMFVWALGERFAKRLQKNPVTDTARVQENGPRDRTLSDPELAAILKAAPENDYGHMVRLLLLTGQRRDEIGGLRWSEIHDLNDPDRARIELPGERTKNWRAHVVPLSEPARQILLSRHREANRDFVFGRGAKGFGAWSPFKKQLDEASGVRRWRLHDLRRTVATGMADLGVQPHIVEAVLNHISGHKAGVAGIYNRSTYSTEKRAALDLWANHITEAVLRGGQRAA